jgi:hypothetical protein
MPLLIVEYRKIDKGIDPLLNNKIMVIMNPIQSEFYLFKHFNLSGFFL